MTGDLTVLGSPLFPRFVELAIQGFEFALLPDGTVQICPIDQLPADTRALMRQYPADLRRLVSITMDPEVLERRQIFAELLAHTPAPRVPAFLFVPSVAYTKGRCFSCGQPLPRWTFGRCWRCALAWRLVCRLPIAVALAAALDDAKVIA
jgi:hypothetical protein